MTSASFDRTIRSFTIQENSASVNISSLASSTKGSIIAGLLTVVLTGVSQVMLVLRL